MTEAKPQRAIAVPVMNVGAIVVSVALFIIVTTWIVVVMNHIGTVPVYNNDGTVRMDEYSHAKDILALLLPLLTIAAGLWLGSQGQARRKAGRCRHRGRETAQDQQAAILSVSPPVPDGLEVLKAAKRPIRTRSACRLTGQSRRE